MCSSRLGAAVDDMTSSLPPAARIFPRATPPATGFIQPPSGIPRIEIAPKKLSEGLVP